LSNYPDSIMTLNCNGKLIDVTQPKVMGILNITPDSFYDGGKHKSNKALLIQVEKMLVEGATFIDIGAYSSRPGADFVAEDEELKRILPVVKLLLSTFPDMLLSIDTFRSKVAAECLALGASIINDISAGEQDENMFKIVSKYKAPYVMMHMRGTPKNMQQQTTYGNLSIDILKYFSERIEKAKDFPLHDIIIDPGFGFAKTLAQNYELLGQLDLFKNLGHPILVGVSRKSMIYKVLNTSPENALNGTTALHSIALSKGAQILRAHDVQEAVECIKLHQQLA